MARGVGGGVIIRGRQLFLIFLSKVGDYSREAINRGMAIIRRNTVYMSLFKRPWPESWSSWESNLQHPFLQSSIVSTGLTGTVLLYQM